MGCSRWICRARGKLSSLAQVYFLPQNPRAFERDHLAWGQHDGIPRLRIASTTLILFLDAEFAETADQDIFSLFQALFDNLKKGLNDVSRFGLGKNVLGKQILYDVGLGQCHAFFLSFLANWALNALFLGNGIFLEFS